MLSKKQMEMIREFSDVEIEVNPDFEALGASYLKKYGRHLTKPAIIMKGSPVENDPLLDEAIRVHEYGHIYCGHLWINHTRQKKLMKDAMKNVDSSLKLTQSGYHQVQNICMDIEVNTTVLTVPQVFYLQSHDKSPCVAEEFNAEPGLRFMKYYEPVLRNLADKAKEQQKQNEAQGIKSNSQAIFEQLIEDAAQSSGQMGDMSEESDSADQDGRKENSTPRGRDENDERSEQELQAGLGMGMSGISDSDSFSMSHGYGYGSGGGADKTVAVKKTADQAIGEVLKKIVVKDRGFKVTFDTNRLANRQSRGNNGLRYTSVRRKFIRTEDPKFAFIVDISGSMDDDVVKKIMGQLKALSEKINKKSELITWNEQLVDRFNIRNLPDHIRTSGGTDLAPAVTYCTEEGFSDIILISDFGTPDMTESLENSSSNVYLIAYGDYAESIKRTGGFDLLKGAWLVENDQVEDIKC